MFISATVPVGFQNYLRVVIRLILAVLLILLVGALSCSVAMARKPKRVQLSVEDRFQAEQRLWDLGYWAGPVDGDFDSASRHAFVAFQKVEGRPRTGVLTANELSELRTASRPRPVRGNDFHVEIDLQRQVLFLVDASGTVTKILSVSTGNGELYTDKGQVHRARTPIGTYRVLRKINGWRLSSLGLLYFPSYIFNGIAIHGSLSIPYYPASHGCIRVPMYAAKELSSLLPVGTEVIIYDDSPHWARAFARLMKLG
jgi:peptidoglycan hydrolase-like protein with peptidoglycan-binding domain